MLVPTKDGEVQPKLVGKKKFWWCTKHNKWSPFHQEVAAGD
jgi:hypothetical protein